MTGLTGKEAKLLAALLRCEGEFVRGRYLAAHLDVPMEALTNLVAGLRRKRSNLTIQGRKGGGYRLLAQRKDEEVPLAVPMVPEVPEVPEVQPVYWPPAKPQRRPIGQTYSGHASLGDSMRLLGSLPAGCAEMVNIIGLESGETATQCVGRLLRYGVEVHRDLVDQGANPISLVRPKTGRTAGDEAEEA